MYEDAFETKFLKATEALYHEEGNRYMQETDVSYHLFQYSLTTGLKKALIPACPLDNQLSNYYLFSYIVPRQTTCSAWALAYGASENEKLPAQYKNLLVLVVDNQAVLFLGPDNHDEKVSPW